MRINVGCHDILVVQCNHAPNTQYTKHVLGCARKKVAKSKNNLVSKLALFSRLALAMDFPTRNEQQKIVTTMKTCHVVRRRPDTIAAFAIFPTKNKVVFFLETQMFVDAREHNFQASLKITAVELFVNTSFHRAPLFSRFLWHACVETSHHKKAAIFGTCVLRINGFFETIRIGEFAFERIPQKNQA